MIKILLNAIIGKKTEVGFYMIREVVHDPLFLSGKSEKATKEDLQVAQDLLDTLMANRAYRYRLYPTTEQCTLLSKTFGCCRKV